MRSCLSSRKLRKDVVDSLRPCRRNAVTILGPAEEKKQILQQGFGGQPHPLPKPQLVGDSPVVGALQPTAPDHGNAAGSPTLHPHRDFEEEYDSSQLLFQRTRAPLCFPPPPVSSPLSSGKYSPASTAMACKAPGALGVLQEHPSPSSSSSLSLNDPSSPPWSSCSPVTTSDLVARLETTPLLPAPMVSPEHRKWLGDADPPLQCSSPLTSSSSSSASLSKRRSGSVVADIRKEVKVFGLSEIERACSESNREHGIVIVGDESVITAWIGEDDGAEAKKTLVAVVCKHRHSHQGLKDWAAKVNLISRVDDHQICKLQGYCGSDEEQILVYEHVCNGSLSDYLFGSLCKALLDWRCRMRIALGAARALAYIHDLAPIEVVYKDFKSSNILLDLDFSVKLAGHGLDVIAWEEDKLNKAASKVVRESEAAAKRNIRSYGVFLLELLTGKSMADEEFLNDDKLFVKWAKPYLRGEGDQLGIILDPHLRRQQHHPCSGLKKVAELTLQCLRKNPDHRPTISEVVEALDTATLTSQPSCKLLQRGMHKYMNLRRVRHSSLKGFSRIRSNKQF